MPESNESVDLLCLGEPMLEFNAQADGRYLPGHGGDVCNCAAAAARQGARVGVLTRLGADAFGDSFMALWRSEGIDARHVRRDPSAPTGIYFVHHDAGGHNFSYYRRDSAASRITVADLPLQAIAQARVLHTSGISLAISTSSADTVFAAMSAARDAGRTVAFDTNLRLNLWPLARARAMIDAAVALADIVLPGLDDARELTGLHEPDAIVDAYLRRGAAIVALTLGADGTLVATTNERRRIAAFPVQAVDATAAGDTFDGAFLAQWLAGADAFEAARYANAAAALSTLGFGAVTPMPRRAQVLEFLAQRTDRA
ncbi:MAG: sugar kinase [Burkholderiaceae bacterium]